MNNVWFIKRVADKLWWNGTGWDQSVAKKMTLAQAGTLLAELPGGMEERTYKLIQQKVKADES